MTKADPSKYFLIKKLTFRIILVLVLLGIFAFLSFYIYHTTIRMSESDGYMINLSGHQRFLSQRIVLLSYALSAEQQKNKRDSLRKELSVSLELMKSEHNYLIHDPNVSEHYRSAEIKEIYFDKKINLDEKVHRFFTTVKIFLNESGSSMKVGNIHLDSLLRFSSDLLWGLEEVVGQYQRENQKDIFSFQRKKQLVFVSTFVLLYLVWFLIFRPMIKEIRNNISQLQRNEYELKELNCNLEKIVEKRTLELEDSNSQLINQVSILKKTTKKLNILSNAIEQTDDTVMITDNHGIIQYVNSTFEKKTGYSKPEVIGKKSNILKSGMHSKEFYAEMWKTILNNEAFHAVMINKKKNGELFWEERTITPLKINSEKITHFISTGTDITEKIKIEKEIAEKDKKYRNLVNEMNEGLVYADVEGQIVFVNNKFCEILGYSEKEIIGKPIYDFLFSRNIQTFKEKLRQRQLGKSEQYEIKNPCGDGSEKWIYVSASPYYDNEKITGAMAVISDITERKTTEISFSELSHFNEILLQTIPLGMLVSDIEGNVLYSNKIINDIAGTVVEGKKCWSIINDKKSVCPGCIIEKNFLSGEKNICQMQDIFDGKTVQIFQSGINFKNKKAVLEVFVDITKLKDTEEKLVNKNKELETFIYRASHDMRSPIANIFGLMNLYGKKMELEDLKECAHFVEQSAKRLDTILHELIDIGRIHNQNMNISKIDFEEMLQNIIESVKHNPNFNNFKISTEIRVMNDFISDQSLIGSIFQNLIENAAKYKKPSEKTPYVSIKISDYKNGVKIQVLDNGQGMSKEVQKKVFDMFFRGNESSSGSGLGLYIVKTSVEKLRGTIKLQSEPETETVFNIFIPSYDKSKSNSILSNFLS